ncbi:type I-C CRISPR-associated protein Cas5 [Aminipila luticellarii]|uniref:pre-crRNA processing endonuclease n=2 Tax=Aminipila luticellarii TaxID=2507160 RepID=A0A410PYW2_9FIRM|nr:type I-C CRISPR-associated protein Cas5 [Aminipila luticellarii]
MIKKRNSVEFEVYGKYALFSDPITRVGGEKFSYQVPTYQALKGILESVYWKPTFIWVIDAVRVMNKIQTEGKGIRPIKMNGGNDLSYYTYLKEARYQVLAHFEWNENRPGLQNDRNENKHHNIAKRSIGKGGRRDIFLGTRECQGYVEHCEFGRGSGFYDDYGELNFGFMFHGIDYPDENPTKNEEGIPLRNFDVRFYNCTMKDGIILFPAPSDSSLKRRTVFENQQMKEFVIGQNLLPVETEGGDE